MIECQFKHGWITLMLQIKAEYERKYVENKADRVIL